MSEVPQKTDSQEIKLVVIGVNTTTEYANQFFEQFNGYKGIIKQRGNMFLVSFDDTDGANHLISFSQENGYVCRRVNDKIIDNVFNNTYKGLF